MKNRIQLLVGLSLLISVSVYALPRFASRMNMPCQSCHVNPSGGGMRNAFGLTYGRDDISVKAWQKEYALNDFTTQITDFLSYGADFRFLAVYQTIKQTGRADESRSTFFPMQADVYLNLAISKKVNLFVNPAFGPYNRYEVFGIARILPAKGYVKLGRFTPSYGLRLDDHTSFVRQVTPFRNNSGQQTGLEVGFNPGLFNLLGALTNGTAGDRDNDLAKAVLGRAEGRLGVGPLNLMAGLSTYNDVSGGERYNILGAFGTVSLHEGLTVVAEANWIKGNSASMSINAVRLDRNTAGRSLKQFTLMVEADCPVIQGVDVKFLYDFFDPNTDAQSGKAERYSAGVEFMPFSGLEVRPLLRITKDTTIPNRDYTDVHVMFHLYL